MSPRPPADTRDEILSTTRQKLLQAAAAMFAENGYVGANINKISTAAGFAKGTIYNYFPSKRALMLALIDEVAANHTSVITALVDTEEDPTLRLKLFFEAGFSFVEQHPIQAQIVISVVYGHDAEFKQRFYETYNDLFNLMIDDIVGVGIAQGDFRSTNSDFIGALLMSLYLGSMSQLDPKGKIWLDPNDIMTFVMEGLGQGIDIGKNQE